jgi:hypothetical protein
MHLVLIILLLVSMCGCSTVETVGRQTYELERNKYVTVSLDGDVKSHGRRQIRRELSRESVLEAAEGLAGLSVIAPKSITLKRGTQSYRIRFSDMTTRKWKNFLLQDGDEIVVHRILF